MDRDSADVACGLVDLGIGSKSDLYVIQSRDSKSDMNPTGQPPSLDASSYTTEEEKLLDIDSGGVSGAFVGSVDDCVWSWTSMSCLVGGGGVLGSCWVIFRVDLSFSL